MQETSMIDIKQMLIKLGGFPFMIAMCQENGQWNKPSNLILQEANENQTLAKTTWICFMENPQVFLTCW